ncbi:MAG TPA: (d)CMP kinase [Terriglobales bacterium]|nr:(d)CMP kinase [Terriglobales bacterium]
MTKATRHKLIIAIDGPAGAGKSTVASHLARKLGYINLETGAMYRALGLRALEAKIPLDDEQQLAELARHSAISLIPTGDGNRVLLDGRDVSERIRESDVTAAASQVSVHPAVREWMVVCQRDMGKQGGVVMEGRDIGTKVFPDADIKIFLDADESVRAERRIRQHSVESSADYAKKIAEEMRQRDRRDTTRATSPLLAAADAVILDSSHMSLDEVLSTIEKLVNEKLLSRAITQS